MGPSESAGKNVSAPTIRITPVSRMVKRDEFTGKVPGDGGTLFFWARLPAIASIGIIIRNRPDSIVKPSAMLYQCVFAFRPAKAEPLLPAAEVKAYRIS